MSPAPAATPEPRAAPPAASPAPSAALDQSRFLNAVFQVARKEFMQHLRTRRLLIIGLVMVGFLVFITLVVGPRIVKSVDEVNAGFISGENLVLAFYFAAALIGGLQFTQLLGIVLTADAVCSEWSNRTIFLLLSKPVSRTAFVLGKYLGNVFTLVVTLLVLFCTAYLVMQGVYEGSPSGEEVMGFFGMLGMIVLGCAAFAAISLFLSTLTKSTVTSLLLMLSLWLIAFPVLGLMGFFMHMGERGIGFDDPEIQGWFYLNPAADMQAGVRLLAPNPLAEDVVSGVQRSNPFAFAPNDIGLAALVLVGYIVLFLGASLFVVNRRNFE